MCPDTGDWRDKMSSDIRSEVQHDVSGVPGLVGSLILAAFVNPLVESDARNEGIHTSQLIIAPKSPQIV